MSLSFSPADSPNAPGTGEKDIAASIDITDIVAAKLQFLAQLCHELRTPLHSVIGISSLLSETLITTEQLEYAKTLGEASQSLLTIINDILDFAKLQSCRISLEHVPFDLRATIESSIQLVYSELSRKGIALHRYFQPDLPSWVIGDPGRMRQVINNLLSNAIKFTNRGSVSLRVELIDISSETRMMKITVEDTGIGISPEALAKIFEPYVQADATISRKFGGTGLGLMICKQLVDLMGGEIGVQSVLSKGSQFWFTTPLAIASTPQVDISPHTVRSLFPAPILVADNNSTSLTLINTLLRNSELNISIANNAKEVNEKLLISSENNMPYGFALIGMELADFEQCVYALKCPEEPSKAVPFIVISSSPERGQAAMVRQKGAAGYLSHPITHSELYSFIDVFIKARSQAKASGQAAPFITRHYVEEIRPTKRMPVLVVDDDRTCQIATVRMLEKMGCQADAVSSGADAINTFLNKPYALILLDFYLPDMSGSEAAAIIRQKVDPLKKIRIILLSGTTSFDENASLAKNIDAYLIKPVSFDSLEKTILRCMSMS